MKKILSAAALACIAAVAPWTGASAFAQGSAAAAVPAAKEDAAAGPSFLDSDMFKEIQADQISFDDANNAQFTGNVVLKGDLAIKCSNMKVISENDTLVAKGNPVEVEQPDMKASCQTLVYNTKTKSSRLTGNPVIHQKQGERTITTSGDTITITQKENGKVSVNVEMDPGSNRRPKITVDAPEKKADAKSGGGAAQRVETPAMVKMPSTL